MSFNVVVQFTPRTSYKTLKHKSSGFCVHPLSGTPKSGTSAILWQDDCNEDRLQLDLFKLPGWSRIWIFGILSCFIANVNTNIISGVLSHGNMTLKHAIEHVKRVGISLVFMKIPWDMGYYMVWGRYRKLRSIFYRLQTFCKMIGRWIKG